MFYFSAAHPTNFSDPAPGRWQIDARANRATVIVWALNFQVQGQDTMRKLRPEINPAWHFPQCEKIHLSIRKRYYRPSFLPLYYGASLLTPPGPCDLVSLILLTSPRRNCNAPIFSVREGFNAKQSKLQLRLLADIKPVPP